MFKTFSKVEMGSKGKQAANKTKNDRQQVSRQSDFSDPFLAAGLSDLLQYDAAAAFQYPPPSSGGDDANFHAQKNFEMPNFDNFAQQNPNTQAFNDSNFREPPPAQQPPMSFNHPQQFFQPTPAQPQHQQQPSSLAKKPPQAPHQQDYMNLNVNMNITNFNINYNFGQQQQSQQQT